MSVWDNIVGQTPAVTTLKTVVENRDEVTQSWLIAGPPGSGRSFVARDFAAALECPRGGCGECKVCLSVLNDTHPDVTVLSTDKVTISIDDVRTLITDSEQMPATAPWRIMIIEDVDRMTERTTNVLLKEIEEPADHTIWLLCAPSAQDVLPTIRSRTRLLTLAVPSNEAVEKFLLETVHVTPAIASQASRIAEGHIGLAKMYATDRALLTARSHVIDGVLNLRRTSDGIVLAEEILTEAGQQAEHEVETRVAAAQVAFREANGLGEKDMIPSVIRRDYNALSKADDRKRLVTRVSRDVLDRTLNDIASIYRDVSVLQNRAEEGAGLVNLEHRSAITDLSITLTKQEAINRVGSVTLARKRLNGNGAPQLVFEALFAALVPPFTA